MTQQNENQAVRTLLDRVDSLEKSNRRMKRLGAGLIGGTLALSLLGAATPFCKTVWAERLVLRNGSGKDVMTFDAWGGAHTSVTMRDEKGKSVLRLSWQDGLRMEMLDAQGKAATTVSLDREGKTTVAKRDGDGDMVSMAD